MDPDGDTSEAELLQAWRIQMLYKRRQSEASVLHHKVSSTNDGGVPPLKRKLSVPEDGLWAGLLPQAPAYQQHKGGLVVPNRHSGGSPRRSTTPNGEVDAWLMALRAQHQVSCSRRHSIIRRSSVNAERRRKLVVAVFAAFGAMLVALAVLMVTVTLKISPEIDKIVRKENEQLNAALNRAGATDDMGGAVSDIMANFTSSSTENTSSTLQNITTAPP